MKHYTNQEVEDFFKSIWHAKNKWGTPGSCSIDVKMNTPDCVQVKLEDMYEAPGLNFAKLSAVSEFFDTKNIDDPDTFSSGGCETCDYGSSYGFTLVMRPDKAVL